MGISSGFYELAVFSLSVSALSALLIAGDIFLWNRRQKMPVMTLCSRLVASGQDRWLYCSTGVSGGNQRRDGRKRNHFGNQSW